MLRHLKYKIHRSMSRRRFHQRGLRNRDRVNRLFVCFLLVIMILSLMIMFTERRIKPTVVAIGQAKAKVIAMDVINKSVKDTLKDYGYMDLFHVTIDDNKKISMVEPNTVEINNFVSDTIELVQRRLNDLNKTKTYIYFGSAINSQLFANMGPKIYLKLYPVGSVDIDYKTTFDKAGINQTRYMLELVVNVHMQIVAPLIDDNVKVSNNMPIAEIIIVGDVPDSYIDINDKVPIALPAK